MITETPVKPKLKYNISRRIWQLPGSYQTNRYKLCIELEISDRTLDRWIKTALTDKFSIPTDGFYIIASFLECNPTDLLNDGNYAE